MLLSKKVLFIILILFPILIGGCWNYRGLDKLAIVAGVAIDRGQDPKKNIIITVQIVKPGEVKSGGEGGGGRSSTSKEIPVLLIQGVGRTVYEAVQSMDHQLGRRLYWSHNQVIIIGKNAAENGVRPLLDYFVRDHESRPTVKILVSQGQAADVLMVPGGLEKISAMEISQLVEVQESTSETPNIILQDLLSRLMSRTTAPIAPRVEIYGNQAEKKIFVFGTAVFLNDKLIGFLDKRESRGLLWVSGKVQSGVILVKFSKDPGEISLEVVRSKSIVKVDLKNNIPKVQIAIDLQSNLGSQSTMADLSKPDKLKELGNLEEKVIKNEVSAAFQKVKELHADVFGFGDAIHRTYPKQWKTIEPNWDKLFPSLLIDVVVKANIVQTGLITKPLVPPKEDN